MFFIEIFSLNIRDLTDHISNYNNFAKETGNKFKNLDEKKMDKFDLGFFL